MNTPPGSWSNKVLKGNTRHEVDNKYGVNDGQDSVSKVNTIDKTYQKSINANKKTNKIKNKIKNNKTQNNSNSKNKVVVHPDGEKRILSQTQCPDDTWPSNAPDKDETLPEGWKHKNQLMDGNYDLDSAGGAEGVNTPTGHTGNTIGDATLPEGWKDESAKRLESKMEKLRLKWAGGDYEVILDKLEMLEGWKATGGDEVKEALADWMLENDLDTLVEEGEDILDGMELMEGVGEVSKELLMDSTEIITSIIVARNMMYDQEMPTFLKDGNRESANNISRIGRASSMVKIREELMKKKELRKQSNLRTVTEDDFEDLEVRKVKRKESLRGNGLRSKDVDNNLIQDKGSKIQIVGSDVEALYPSLDAVEVAQIVFNAMMKTEIKFKGVNYMEACRMIALTSTEQECRLGPLKRVLPVRRHVNGTRPGISGEDPMSKDCGSQDQWKFPPLGKNGLLKKEKRMILAEVMRKAVLAIFKTHTYKFARKYYLQRRGGGLSASAVSVVSPGSS